jgi:hypothetical protein
VGIQLGRGRLYPQKTILSETNLKNGRLSLVMKNKLVGYEVPAVVSAKMAVI